MRVAVIAHNPLGESPGTNYRIIELGRELARLGVEYLILSPHEPDVELAPGVRIVGLSGPLARAISRVAYGLGRALLYHRGTARALLRLLTSELVIKELSRGAAKALSGLDVDIVQGTQDVESLPYLLAARELGLPFVMDLHNLTSEEMLDAGLLRPGDALLARLRELERELVHGADVVVPVSEELAQFVREEYGVERGKIVVVRSGGRPVADEVGWEEPKRIVHAGMMVYRCWPGLLVKTMALTAKRRPGASFYTARRGELLDRALRLAKRLGLSLRTYWFDEPTALRCFLTGSYVGLITSTVSQARRFGYPAKLFEYMSAGLPMVANDVGGWTDIIRRERIGLVCPNEAGTLAEAIDWLLDDEEAAIEMGSRCLGLVRGDFSWRASAERMLHAYELAA